MLLRLMVVALSLTVFSEASMARDDKLFFSLESAMNSDLAKMKLDQEVTFSFGEQAPAFTDKKGTFVSNKKTNAFNKSDQAACERAFISAMLSLRDRALKEGGNAVVNIHSFYNQDAYFSDTDYECHAGAVMAGVALKGTVVTVK
ncbi:excinuclease ATPase subunit [Pseudomaricurvus hydrocarbonicus]|uniref:excinuclease ATPase subunit n=1 Tax=Pseudomaricurvus hydrocarbonicus TaxID=1470433 RepID=UPI001AA01479|nr:excinuclease ATPase subunit [Aestuariicella hydrocarbonica]